MSFRPSRTGHRTLTDSSSLQGQVMDAVNAGQQMCPLIYKDCIAMDHKLVRSASHGRVEYRSANLPIKPTRTGLRALTHPVCKDKFASHGSGDSNKL